MPLHFRIFKIANFISTNGANFSRESLFEIVWVAICCCIGCQISWSVRNFYLREMTLSPSVKKRCWMDDIIYRVSIGKIVLYDPDGNRQISTWMRRNILAGWLAVASWAVLGRAGPCRAVQPRYAIITNACLLHSFKSMNAKEGRGGKGWSGRERSVLGKRCVLVKSTYSLAQHKRTSECCSLRFHASFVLLAIAHFWVPKRYSKYMNLCVIYFYMFNI